jgi:two-component system CheB/CheR fusion protein
LSIGDRPAPPDTATVELTDRLFRTHFENLPDPAFMWRRDGDDFRLVAHNRAGAVVSEVAVGNFIGIRASELYKDQPDVAATLHGCADSGMVVNREFDYRYSSGTVRRLLATYVPLNREIVVAHARDLTAQRVNERELVQSEARLRAVMEANPDLIFRMDAEARFIDVHVPDSIRLPWTTDELIGSTVGDFLARDVHDRHLRAIAEARRTGTPQLLEFRLQLGSRGLDLESRIVDTGNGDAIVTVRDVSERVALEARMTVQAERERHRLGQEIHDGLAQNLTAARMLLDHLERRLRSPEPVLADEALQAAELIGLTIEQAREIVRGLSPIPKNSTVFSALKVLSAHAERYLGIECRLVVEGEPNELGELGELATAHLYRIAQEAITNAVKHGKAKVIDLSCRIADGQISLTIADDGTGLRDGAETAGGFGLRIMRHRVRAIGGQLSVTRRREGGTIVSCSCSVPAAA